MSNKAMPIIYGLGAAMAVGTVALMAGKGGKKRAMKKKVKKTANKAITAVGDILDSMPTMK